MVARSGWPGLERLREVPECAIYAKIGRVARSGGFAEGPVSLR